MSMIRHIRLMLGYNTRMNRQVYQQATLLNDEQRKKDTGAYFKSVHGTLNHLFVGDLLWLRRFHEHHPHFKNLENLCFFPQPQALDEELYDDFDIMCEGRIQLDRILDMWGQQDLKAGDLGKDLTWVSRFSGKATTKNFGELVLHMLNHQTHHRGQVSALLMQFGRDVGVTDFLVDIPEKYKQGKENK